MLKIKDVRKVYEVYTKTVSKAGWPIGWRVSTLLIGLMNKMKLNRILDLGSGWSSYLLRLGGAKVWSIDTDAKWLEKTKSFLTQFNQLNGHFGLLEDFEFPTEQTYDLVLIDSKPGARRYEMFPSIKRCCKGIVVFDDWNNDKIREPAERIFNDWNIQNLERETKDRWERFIAVAYRGTDYHAVIELLKEESLADN